MKKELQQQAVKMKKAPTKLFSKLSIGSKKDTGAGIHESTPKALNEEYKSLSEFELLETLGARPPPAWPSSTTTAAPSLSARAGRGRDVGAAGTDDGAAYRGVRVTTGRRHRDVRPRQDLPA